MSCECLRWMCVALFTGLPPPFLHAANDKKNWTVGRPVNETKMCKHTSTCFVYRSFHLYKSPTRLGRSWMKSVRFSVCTFMFSVCTFMFLE